LDLTVQEEYGENGGVRGLEHITYEGKGERGNLPCSVR